MAIEQRPERVTWGITLVQGGEHPLDNAARDPIIPRRIVPELPASPIAWSPGPVQLGHINFFILELMFISGFVQGILIHGGLKIKCCFITVEDIESSVDFKRQRLLDRQGMIRLCVNVDGDIVGLSVKLKSKIIQ